MVRKILIGIFIVSLLLGFHFYISNFVYPNTYIGDIAIGGLTHKEVAQLLSKKEMNIINLQIGQRIYKYNYNDLGIIYDKRKTYEDVISQSNSYPGKVINFIRSFGKETIISPQLIFTQDYYTLIQKPRLEIKEKDGNEIKKYQIDPEALKTQIIVGFGYKKVMEVTLAEDGSLGVNDPILLTRRMSHIYEKPIDIVISEKDKMQHIQLDSGDVKGVSTTSLDSTENVVNIMIDSNALEARIKSKKSDINLNSHSLSRVHDNILSLLRNRLEGMDTEFVKLDSESKPMTDGKRAERYIEINTTGKKLYLFFNGAVVGNYIVSTSSCTKVPDGKFSVIKKLDLAFSHKQKQWMKYWIGFDYQEDSNRILGISEVPYKNNTKEKGSLPKEEKGKVSTEPCFGLPIDMTKEIYDFSIENMPIYVLK